MIEHYKKIEVTRRALECGRYLFVECKERKNSWHVPGGGIMTTREISTWARNYGISRETKVVARKFYYTDPRSVV